MSSDEQFVRELDLKIEEAIGELRRSAGTAEICAEVADAFSRRLMTRLLGEAKEPRLQQMTISQMQKRLDEAARQFGLPFPRRRLIKPPQPPLPLRRDGWQEAAGFAFSCWDGLHQHLDHRCRGMKDEDFAGVLLATAVFRSLMLRPLAWPAFLAALSRNDLVLHRVSALPDLPWFELELPLVGSAATNHVGKTERLRVFPDIVTLALLRQWQRRSCHLTRVPTTAAEALRLMARAVLGREPPRCPDPSSFAAAAMAPWEDQMEIPLPYGLAAVASGQLTGFSASDRSWLILHGAQNEDQGNEAGTRRRKRKSESDEGPGGETSPSSSHMALSAALATLPKGAGKQTRKPVERALDALPRRGLTPAAHALRIWYISLLQQRRAISTIQRYHSAISRPLLTLCQNRDPADWDGADLEDLVAAIIAADDGTDTPYAIGRLVQFCHFAAQNPALYWPELDPSVATGFGGERHPRIRTALMSGDQISRALKHWPIENGSELRDLECAAFLLSVRGGLRLGELEALTVGDVTPGPQGALYIHNTRWADIKSSAGRRKLPVQLLATFTEARLLEKFFLRRIRDAGSPREQLLSLPASLLERTRFSREGFARRLKATTGLGPHDLRHAALSNLGLLLMLPVRQVSSLQRITGWNAAQQERIKTGLLGENPDPRRVLTQLARIAGHARPETTVRSYIHLADLALGLLLHANPEQMPGEQAARWLGLNARSLNAAASDKPAELRQGRQPVLSALAIRQLRRREASPQVEPLKIPEPVIGADLVLRLLRARDQGRDEQELAETYGLSRQQLHRIAAMAKDLQPPRSGQSTPRLAPILPRQTAAMSLCQLLMRHLENIDADERIAWSLQTLRAARARDLVFASEAQFEAWRTSVSLPMMGTDWMIHRGRSRIRVAPMLIERTEMAPMTCLTTPAKIALCLWAADQADAAARAKIVRVVRSP
jgi:integrase